MTDNSNTTGQDSTDSQATPLKPPLENEKNIEAKKYYIFNQTGNIMVSSTSDTSEPISDSVQQVFSEVSVFFAAMARAIVTTKNPATGKPYSLYNYHALQQIIDGSGLFVQVTAEDVRYKTDSFGADFSKTLIESLLGLATGAGEMAFATAMVASIGKEGLRISGSTTDTESKVANIVFVCEFLLGMPMVSAIVVSADCKKHVQQIQAGPCFKETHIETEWHLHKDTYFFVTPTFIKEYAYDLDSVEANAAYIELIHWLQGLLIETPIVFSLVDEDHNPIEGGTLKTGQKYVMLGRFLGGSPGKLKFGDTNIPVTQSDWSPTEIAFSFATAPEGTHAIDVCDTTGKVIVSSPQSYTFKSA